MLKGGLNRSSQPLNSISQPMSNKRRISRDGWPPRGHFAWKVVEQNTRASSAGSPVNKRHPFGDFFFIPKMFFRYIWQCGIWRITSKAAALIRKRVSVLKRIPCLAKKQGQIKCLPICIGGRGSDVSWLFNKKKGGGEPLVIRSLG